MTGRSCSDTGFDAATTTTQPVSAAEFASLLESLGPFGSGPRLAVATSGGADSLALAVLSHDWATARGGAVQAVTVDHGLRVGSAAEARRVRTILRPLGIAHKILTWSGEVPTANLQAVARAARYHLLLDHCARNGVFHLLLAHHRDDQAETLLLRLGRGSGLDGLAAMSAKIALPQAVVLRPLLGLPRQRLAATLQNRGIDWIEDPSNVDTAHARVRLRRLLPALAEEGLGAGRLAAAAGHLGRARAALEGAVAAVLARAARIDPAGYIRLDPRPLHSAEAEVGQRALAHAVMTVGGRPYTPRWERLSGLFARIGEAGFRGATLGGCRILRQRDVLLIVREASAVESVMVRSGTKLRWDGRFEIELAGDLDGGPFQLGGLGKAAWRELVTDQPESRKASPPASARAGLPALFDSFGLKEVPHMGYERKGIKRGPEGRSIRACNFAPSAALTSSGFTVA